MFQKQTQLYFSDSYQKKTHLEYIDLKHDKKYGINELNTSKDKRI